MDTRGCRIALCYTVILKFQAESMSVGKSSCCTDILWFLHFFRIGTSPAGSHCNPWAAQTHRLTKQTLPLKIWYYASVLKPPLPAGRREGLAKTSRTGCSSRTTWLMPSLQQKVLIMQISPHSSQSPSTARDMPMAVLTCMTRVAGGSLHWALLRCRVRTSPYPEVLIFPVSKETEGEVKSRQKNKSGSQGYRKTRFLYLKLLN